MRDVSESVRSVSEMEEKYIAMQSEYGYDIPVDYLYSLVIEQMETITESPK